MAIFNPLRWVNGKHDCAEPAKSTSAEELDPSISTLPDWHASQVPAVLAGIYKLTRLATSPSTFVIIAREVALSRIDGNDHIYGAVAGQPLQEERISLAGVIGRDVLPTICRTGDTIIVERMDGSLHVPAFSNRASPNLMIPDEAGRQTAAAIKAVASISTAVASPAVETPAPEMTSAFSVLVRRSIVAHYLIGAEFTIPDLQAVMRRDYPTEFEGDRDRYGAMACAVGNLREKGGLSSRKVGLGPTNPSGSRNIYRVEREIDEWGQPKS